MGSVTVKLNSAGCKEVLNSSGVQNVLMNKASEINGRANSSGKGTYIADVQPGAGRAHAMVKTADGWAAYENSRHNTLLKAMRG